MKTKKVFWLQKSVVLAGAFLVDLSVDLTDSEGMMGPAADAAADVDPDAFAGYQGEVPDLLAKFAREPGE